MTKRIVKKQRKSLEPLEEIKRLLMLQLVMNGATSEDIAEVLGIDSSTIRHMIPIRKLKKSSKKRFSE